MVTNEVVASTDDTATAKRSTKEQRDKLGLDGKGRASKTPPPEPTNALQKVDVLLTLYLRFNE